MAQKKTVLIVDDHPLFREGLKAIIGRAPRFEIAGEAGTAKEGFRMAKALNPDLVLIDISLPDQSGIELTRRIRSTLSETRVLIISMHSKINYIGEAFQAGATGYIVKESAAERLLQGLDTVLAGDYYLDSAVSHQVVERILSLPKENARITDRAYGTLTPREQEVMRLLAQGVSNREVAERLFISPKTVENHRTSIMGKLGLHGTIELVRYAARLGLIDIDQWMG
jgi:DNA-binding NarL/FixJ family response regulator